ncbi:Bug family tripartite tricarboxylate transporter substrate binding protein [Cupriavidus basilensis]|uniref:Putative exported protein n=1 Tax=Cupriavidus basilensis TaxID=68895 RepID=A0A0C4YCX7_9BURK|nr:tripartite tricarboxylate transporter substrate binding protein [Cupriavidus basilensis]AJG20743.1 putative exported protein [Cupriavidus basilensis]
MNRRAFGRTAFHTALMLSAPGWFPALARAARPPGPSGFPDKPLHAVVPYPAGGVVDVTLRPAIDRMSLDLPQRVVVENRPGADGRIAIEYAIRAPADGYTILGVTPVLAVAQTLYPNAGIRVQNFRAIGAVAAVPSVFVVHESVPVKTLKEFAAWAKARPGEVNVPVPGSGSSLHLAQELFFETAGIRVTNIGYKGQPPSVPDLAGGQLQFALLSQNLALPMIQAKKLRPLAVNAVKRTRSLPDVPTIAEAGFPDSLVQSWYGLAVHSGTPRPIVDYLGATLQSAMATADVRNKLAALDAEILALDGKQFDTLMQSESARWAALIKARNIKAEA